MNIIKKAMIRGSHFDATTVSDDPAFSDCWIVEGEGSQFWLYKVWAEDGCLYRIHVPSMAQEKIHMSEWMLPEDLL